eukprot:758760-Hanusia_phi.AAC.2
MALALPRFFCPHKIWNEIEILRVASVLLSQGGSCKQQHLLVQSHVLEGVDQRADSNVTRPNEDCFMTAHRDLDICFDVGLKLAPQKPRSEVEQLEVCTMESNSFQPCQFSLAGKSCRSPRVIPVFNLLPGR